jgi:hypothetical protein
MNVTGADHDPPTLLAVYVQLGFSPPKTEPVENVSVIEPELPGVPVPVVATMIPALSLLPVSTAQLGLVPPPDVNVQVVAVRDARIRVANSTPPPAPDSAVVFCVGLPGPHKTEFSSIIDVVLIGTTPQFVPLAANAKPPRKPDQYAAPDGGVGSPITAQFDPLSVTFVPGLGKVESVPLGPVPRAS